MHRFLYRRELSLGLGLVAPRPPGVCAWRTSPTGDQRAVAHRQRAGVCLRPARPLSSWQDRRLLSRSRVVFAGQRQRLLASSQPGDPGHGSGLPAISVVGTPDPITWIRCSFIMFLIKLGFGLDVNSVEFERGVKQALVHVSSMMSTGSYYKLVGMVSTEMIDYVMEQCKSLTRAQRKQLAVAMDDIVLVLPEEVSVVVDDDGRKFCLVVMRFWFLSTHEGPDDPEGTRIFKVAPSEDGSPQKKIATAVYEFHRELSRGARPDWTVKTIWHWHWKAAE